VAPKIKSKAPASVAGAAAAPRRIGVARALSKLGIASRTVAAQWVRAGRVAVNGKIVHDPETPIVPERDRLYVDERPVRAAEKRYVMLNKPRGLVTTARDERGRATVYSCFSDPQDQGLAPVGRLDKASEGLLFFTNDTEWANRLLDPAAHLPKVYHVQIDSHVDEEQLNKMRDGIRLEDRSLLRVSEARVLRSGEKYCWLEITLHEGKNRQIRRVLEALELKVLRLVRVAIGPVKLGTLAKAQSRALTAVELRAVAAAVHLPEQHGKHGAGGEQ
jgi:23S rRNA pseudouridine2605 synthase